MEYTSLSDMYLTEEFKEIMENEGRVILFLIFAVNIIHQEKSNVEVLFSPFFYKIYDCELLGLKYLCIYDIDNTGMHEIL
jgi:hypothetical protein